MCRPGTRFGMRRDSLKSPKPWKRAQAQTSPLRSTAPMAFASARAACDARSGGWACKQSAARACRRGRRRTASPGTKTTRRGTLREERPCARTCGDELAPEIQPALGHGEAQLLRPARAAAAPAPSHRAAGGARRAARRDAGRTRPDSRSSRDRELRQILRVRIHALLDQRQLLDDRPAGRHPAEPQPRREHLGEAVQVDHHACHLVELVERRRRRRRRATARDTCRPRRSARGSARRARSVRGARESAASSRSDSEASGWCTSASAGSAASALRARRGPRARCPSRRAARRRSGSC